MADFSKRLNIARRFFDFSQQVEKVVIGNNDIKLGNSGCYGTI